MATKSQEILLKGNTTNASAVPSSLKVREIAINALDRSLFTNDGNNIVKLYTGTTKWFDVNGNANNALKLGGILASEYINKEAFNSHINNSTIHITAAERAAWNNKWDYNEETIKGVKVNAAVSADKLNSNAGTSAIPIYFKNGKPTQCIPSDLFSGFGNAYSSTETSLGITIAGHTRMVVVAYSQTAGSVAWTGITDKPSTFTPSAHTHTASDITGLPTSLKNPYKLTFGSKSYDGSAAATITASDLGALTAHQSIYALTLQVNGTSQGVYNPASAAKTINIAVPTKTSDITNDSGFITSAAIPTALKNPYAVEIKANGVSLGTYDGSTTATFNLSAANVGAASKIHTHTASEVSGLPTKLSAFTNDVGFVTVRQKNGFSYNNLSTLYTPHASIYRIDLTNVQVNIWTMLFIEVSLRQNYSPGYGGKILINLYHNTTSDFTQFNATILGNLNNINVYSSDRRYIYISASMSYSTISVDRVLVGDNATTADLSNITIEKVDSLPDTYQTATIYNGLHTGNFTKSLVEGVLTGNITSHTHTFASLTSKPTTIAGYGITDALTTSNYNSYAPTLTGTGASGTWGIDISGNAATVGGYSITTNENTPWNTIPYISNFGSMDVGRSFEFHFDNTTGSDFSTVLLCTGDYYNVVMLPSVDGTLALLTDNVASATKLATPRTIWGQSFDGSGDVSGNLSLERDRLYWNGDVNGSYISSDGRTEMIYEMRGGHRFCTGGDVRLLITRFGNVLIGTSNDNGYKLQVEGSERVYGDLIVDGEVSALVA